MCKSFSGFPSPLMQQKVLTMTSWQPLPLSQLVFYLLSSSFLSCCALASPVVFLFRNMPAALPT